MTRKPDDALVSVLLDYTAEQRAALLSRLKQAPGRGRSHPCRPFVGSSAIWTSSSEGGGPMAFRPAWLAAFKAIELMEVPS